jgi:N-acetylmuramoyl-L-alanine amidase
MQIINHEIHPTEGEAIEISNVSSGREAAPLIVPRLIVIHYAVTHSLDATVRAQQARGYWAHLSIDGFKDGARSRMQLVQQVPLNRKASHAGESEWRGVRGCNHFSIGIEIANPGPLLYDNEGGLRTVYGKQWAWDDAIETGSVEGYPRQWGHWAKYTDEETGLLAAVCLLLKEHYPTIDNIVGHSQIAPGRKFDPGPAFPLEWLRTVVLGPTE